MIRISLSAAVWAAGSGVLGTASVPEQIGLNYGKDSSEMVASWAVWDGAAEGIVQYGLSPDNLNLTASTTGASYTMLGYTSPLIYKAVMSDLNDGNQKYFYRVGSDSSGFSDVFSFKSHPGSSKSPITFHIIGDLGQTENSANTLYQINDNEAALTTLSGGIISMGDLSYANGNEPLWDSFGVMRQISTSSIPMFTTLGNHGEFFLQL